MSSQATPTSFKDHLYVDSSLMSLDSQIVLMELVANIEETTGSDGKPTYNYMQIDDLKALNTMYHTGINVQNAIAELYTLGLAKQDKNEVKLKFSDIEISIIRYFHNLIDTTAKGIDLAFDPIQLNVDFYKKVLGRKVLNGKEKNLYKTEFYRAMQALVKKHLVEKKANPNGSGVIYEINKTFIGYTSPLLRLELHFNQMWSEFSREKKYLRKVCVHEIFLFIDGYRTNGAFRFDFNELAHLVMNALDNNWHGWEITKKNSTGEPIELIWKIEGKWKLIGYKREDKNSPSLHIFLVEDEKQAIEISRLGIIVGELKNALQTMNEFALHDIFNFEEDQTSIENALLRRIHYNLDFVLPSGELKKFILRQEVSGMTTFRSHYNNYTIRFYPLVKKGSKWEKLTPSVGNVLVDSEKATIKTTKQNGEVEEKKVTYEMRNEIQVDGIVDSDERSSVTLSQIMKSGGAGINDPVLSTVHGFMTRASYIIESQLYFDTHLFKIANNQEAFKKTTERFEKSLETEINYIIAYTELVDSYIVAISIKFDGVNQKLDGLDQKLDDKFQGVTDSLKNVNEGILKNEKTSKRTKKSVKKLGTIITTKLDALGKDNADLESIIDDVGQRMGMQMEKGFDAMNDSQQAIVETVQEQAKETNQGFTTLTEAVNNQTKIQQADEEKDRALRREVIEEGKKARVAKDLKDWRYAVQKQLNTILTNTIQLINNKKEYSEFSTEMVEALNAIPVLEYVEIETKGADGIKEYTNRINAVLNRVVKTTEEVKASIFRKEVVTRWSFSPPDE